MTATEHLIFTFQKPDGPWKFSERLPFLQDNPDHGLPLSFFEGDHKISFEVHGNDDKIEWWPECGPAPHWSDTLSKYGEDYDAMFAAFEKWWKETY